MLSSYSGTLLRAGGLLISLILFWYLLTSFSYFIVSFIFGFSFEFKTTLYIFVLFIIFRMFYPKNVFK